MQGFYARVDAHGAAAKGLAHEKHLRQGVASGQQ